MKGMKNAIIIIHDFDNGLGHCVYDGERLGMLKEFKSGNLFYKNKRWKIEYFPKK
jgi:hypothetical protein